FVFPSMFLYTSSFFFYAVAAPQIYTLSLHDALPIFRSATFLSRPLFMWPQRSRSRGSWCPKPAKRLPEALCRLGPQRVPWTPSRSEEHTSELQSLAYLVCRLLLEKKKKNNTTTILPI